MTLTCVSSLGYCRRKERDIIGRIRQRALMDKEGKQPDWLIADAADPILDEPSGKGRLSLVMPLACAHPGTGNGRMVTGTVPAGIARRKNEDIYRPASIGRYNVCNKKGRASVIDEHY